MRPITRFLVPIIALLTLTGCQTSIKPVYTVRVVNDSRTTITAAIEHHQNFSDPVALESATLAPGDETTLGPIEMPPLERIYFMAASRSDLSTDPFREKIRRGSYTATISAGGGSSWRPYEIFLTSD